MREYQVRICERLGVQFPGPTRQGRPDSFASTLKVQRSFPKGLTPHWGHRSRRFPAEHAGRADRRNLPTPRYPRPPHRHIAWGGRIRQLPQRQSCPCRDPGFPTLIVVGSYPDCRATVSPFAAAIVPSEAGAQSFSRPSRAPPPLRVERRPGPRRGYVWGSGYWSWSPRRRNYVWTGGRWHRNRPGFRYQSPRWVLRSGNWVFVPGGWVR